MNNFNLFFSVYTNIVRDLRYSPLCLFQQKIWFTYEFYKIVDENTTSKSFLEDLKGGNIQWKKFQEVVFSVLEVRISI